MIDSEIKIDVSAISSRKSLPATQYQDWVARFCYSAAAMPAETVEHILSIMELSSEAQKKVSEQ